MREAAGSRDELLARVQSALGVLPLGAYLVFHLWEQWPALEAREAWMDRARETSSRPWEIALVFAPLALHAGLGLARSARRSRSDARSADERGLDRLQAVTGTLVLAFVAYHVAQVWSLDLGPHASARDGHAALWRAVGRPIDLVIYLVGISCTCLHFAHGLSRAAVTWRLARSPGDIRRARLAAGVVGFVLWGAALHLLARFAIGEGLFRIP